MFLKIKNRLRKYIDFRIDQKSRQLFSNIPYSQRIERSQIMNYAFEFVSKNEVKGPYLEFGIYKGASFIRAYKAAMKWNSKSNEHGWNFSCNEFYAFDSFLGLPHLENSDLLDSYEVFKKGQYSNSKNEVLDNFAENGLNLNKVYTIPGFYSDSLKSKPYISEILSASVIHVDCDLYSSALEVLEYCKPIVQNGTMFLFDDYYCFKGHPNYGVRKAFDEWLIENSFRVTPYYNYSWAGQSFILNIGN